jgi:hypothetical protein
MLKIINQLRIKRGIFLKVFSGVFLVLTLIILLLNLPGKTKVVAAMAIFISNRIVILFFRIGYFTILQ